MKKLALRGMLLLFLVLTIRYIVASALRQPPVIARQWTTTCTGTPQSITLEDTNSNDLMQGPTRAVIFFHDGSPGDADIWIGVAGTTAAAPTNGGQVLTLKQTDKSISYDLELTRISVMSAGANTALRIQVTH